jgi:hypothetical protein
MADVRTYDPRALVCRLWGTTLNGWGEDDAIKLDPGSDESTTKISCDGLQVTRHRIVDPTMTLTVTLNPNSPARKRIDAVIELGRASANGADVGAFYMRDLMSGEEVTAPKAYVEKRPTIEKGKELKAYVYVFRLVDVQLADTEVT